MVKIVRIRSTDVVTNSHEENMDGFVTWAGPRKFISQAAIC